MTVLWIATGALAIIAGLRHRARIRARRSGRVIPEVNDEALDRIIAEGRLQVDEEEPLDLDEAARAEEEFWSEYWDEPDEYRP